MQNKSIVRGCLLLFFIILQLSSAAQVSQLSKDDLSIYKKALKGIEDDPEEAFKILHPLKDAYPANVDVCFEVAECYNKMKKYTKAINEYNYVTSLIKTAQNAPGFGKDQRLKESFEELLKKCKTQRDVCKELVEENNAPPPTPDNNNQSDNTNNDQKENQDINNNQAGFLDYADDGFIPFQSTDPAAQKAELRAHVEQLFKAKFVQNSAGEEQNGNKLMEINQKWLSDNATINYEWFEVFKQKEDVLIKAIMSYVAKHDSLTQTANDLESNRTRLTFYRAQLKSEQDRLRYLEDFIDKEIKNRIFAKLATIPQSIVMIGRIEIKDAGTDPVKIYRQLSDEIDSKLKVMAIERIKGFTFQQSTFTSNNNLRSVFVKTLKGKAKTTDTYYQRIIKSNGPDKFLYKVIRIEVNPYDTSATSTGASGTSGGGESGSNTISERRFDAFRVDTTCKVWQMNDGAETSIDINSDLQFQPEVNRYLKFLCKFSNNLNFKYQEKIVQAAEQYEREIEEVNIRRDTIKAKIARVVNNISTREGNINRFLSILADTMRIYTLKQSVHNAYDDYVKEYKSKTTVTNQIFNVSSAADPLPDITLFGNLSEKCYGVVDDIKRNEVMISVTKIVNEDKNTIKNSRLSVKFEAIPKEYMVLSINKVKSNAEAEPILFLNVAFKIGYNTKDIAPMMSSALGNSGNTGNTGNSGNTESIGNPGNSNLTSNKQSQKPKVEEPVNIPKPPESPTLTSGSFVVDESHKTMTENSTHIRWKIYNDNPTSYTLYMASGADAGYSLPSFNELKEFFNKIAYQESNGNSFFSKLFSFKGKESAVFATSEMLAGEQIRCLKVILPSYQIQEEILDEGESMNIISLNRRY